MRYKYIYNLKVYGQAKHKTLSSCQIQYRPIKTHSFFLVAVFLSLFHNDPKQDLDIIVYRFPIGATNKPWLQLQDLSPQGILTGFGSSALLQVLGHDGMLGASMHA